MFVITIIILLILYKIQRKLCSQPISIKKKVVIPITCFMISLIATYIISSTINNHSNQLITYTNGDSNVVTQTAETDNYSTYSVSDDSKILATLSISKKNIVLLDILKILVLFNIPTALFTFFIISGKVFQKKI